MLTRKLKASYLLLLTTVYVLAPALKASGQAIPSAERRFRLTGYGAISYVQPKYQDAPRNIGATIGGSIETIRPMPLLDVGLDLRYVMSTGVHVNENAFLAGPRVSYTFGALVPYGDYEFGTGKATFNESPDPLYKSDTSRVRAYGGGFDYHVTQNWALRADVQQQRWRFSVKTPYFYPTVATVGVSYQLSPLRSRTGAR